MYADNLKKVRNKMGLSVAKFADLLEIPARTITGYERRERTPSFQLFAQLNIKANVNLNWFVTGKGEMFNAPKYDDVKDDLKIKVLDILKEQGLL